MRLIETNLNEYELTDDELLRGSILSQEQIAIYRNEISRLTRMYMSIKHDMSNPLPTIAEQIALSGQISIYEALISTHMTVVSDVNSSNNSGV